MKTLSTRTLGGAFRTIVAGIGLALAMAAAGPVAHAAAVKFVVCDSSNAVMNKFTAAWADGGTYTIHVGNNRGSGIFVVGTTVYVLDKSDRWLYRYELNGGAYIDQLLPMRNADSSPLSNPVGLAIDGDEVWITDSSKILRYSLADLIGGTGQSLALQEIAFDTAAGHNQTDGMALDATYVYVLDRNDLKFYRYERDGSPATATASQTIATTTGGNPGNLTGAALDGGTMWVVADQNPDRAYSYSLASLFSGAGTLNAATQFNTTAGNSGGVGIVPGGSVAPEIAVYDGATLLVDGQVAKVDVGSSVQGGPSPTQTITVTNIGTNDLTLSALAVTPNTDYSFTNGLVATLTPGQSDTFIISLSNATIGTFEADISFTNNDSNENPFNFPITGIIAPPPNITVADNDTLTTFPTGSGPFNLGIANLCDGALVKTYRINNIVGNSSVLSVTSITVSAPWTRTGFSTGNINDGNFATFDLNLNTLGTHPATVTIVTNDPDTPSFTFSITGQMIQPSIEVKDHGTAAAIAKLSTLNFGTAQIQRTLTKVIRVENNGTDVLDTINLTVSPPYTVTEPLDSSIGVGLFDTFTVSVTSASAGPVNGTASITHSDCGDTPWDFNLAATFTAPEIDVYDNVTLVPSGGNVSLGSTLKGDPAPSKVLRVENGGTTPLLILDVSLPAGYSLTEPLNTSIPAGNFDEFTIELPTTTAGAFNGPLVITNSSAVDGTYTINLSGTITAPEIAVLVDGSTQVPSGTGNVAYGAALKDSTPVSRTFTIQNSGNGTLSVTGVSVPGGFTNTPPPASVGPASSATFDIVMQTATPGTPGGTVTITNSDDDEGSYTFTVGGTVNPEPLSLGDWPDHR